MSVTPSRGSDIPYAVFSGVGYVARKPNWCEMTGDGCIFGFSVVHTRLILRTFPWGTVCYVFRTSHSV